MGKLNLCGEWMVKAVYDITDAQKLSINAYAEDLMPASVPGDIHMDLLRAGKIPDPFFGNNVSKCQWVAERNWCFIKEFHIRDNFIERITELTFKGIDTFSDIYLNGIHIGSTSSMFYRYTFDVRHAIRTGKNILAVMIKSTAKEINKYPHEGYSACFHHERIFIRKSQCHFSWDWAPELLATGIFDEVVLQSYIAGPIRDVFVRAQNTGHAVFFFNFGDNRRSKAQRSIRLTVSGGGTTQVFNIDDIPLSGNKQYILQIQNPLLWWPAGYGKQHMYEYSAELFENGVTVNQYNGRFAFREVEVDETPTDSLEALKFNVKINGVPVFLKGANWVNSDIFTGSVTDEKYRKLLTMVPEGNMNCLRVWGGGFYEKDVFYNLCDELGIMIWQDFMFSCAELPDEFPGFLEKVEKELIQQVTRLRNHPCIVLWSGGNERPGGINDEPCKGEKSFKFLFRGIANHLDPTRPYIYNSPFGYEKPGNCFTSGDVHLSSMTAVLNKHASQYKQELAKLEVPLMSEIACMGSSPVENIRKYIPKASLWPPDDIWALHVRGNPYDGLNENFVIQQQRLASQHFGKVESLEDFAKKSSILQLEHIKADVEFHRSRTFDCSGALLWMLNDIWPCGSWAIIDYYLTKKAGYFGMKRACRPILPVITLHKDGIKAYVINDTPNSVLADVCIIQQDLDGKLITSQNYEMITIRRGSSLISDLSSFDLKRKNSMFFIQIKNSELNVWNSYCVLPFDSLDLPSPSVSVDLKKISNGSYLVCLESDTVARTVYLKAPGAKFDDNYFDMPAGVPLTIRVHSAQPISKSDLQVLTFIDDWE